MSGVRPHTAGRRSTEPQRVEAAVDEAFMRSMVERMSEIGSSTLGFRVAGTPEDDEVCALIADTMREIGLEDVQLEPVPVDGWRFGGAALTAGGADFACAAFGGTPPTSPCGVEGELVFAGRGSREELARTDVGGKIVLFDWPGDHLLWPSLTAAQATRAGARAVICTCLPGGRYYQSAGALGAFGGLWVGGSIPLATIANDDALALIERLRSERLAARLTVDVELAPGATAHNTVGTFPGQRDGAPIVVAGHHDCWFAAGLDDASGVASALGIAKAMLDTGHVSEHPIVFGSHTGEEWGRADSAFDWLIGAGWQINEQHPSWGSTVPFYLNIEGTGLPLPSLLETPPELRRFCRRVCREARRDGLLPWGVRYGHPRTGTEQWPFLAAGVPAVNASSYVTDYLRLQYHTQYDTPAIVSYPDLARQTRFHARLVMAADAAPADLFDLPGRTAELRRRGRLNAAQSAGLAVAPLTASMSRFDEAARASVSWPAKRAAFAIIACAVEAIDARDKQSLLHLQALTDVESLDASSSALERQQLGAASRAAARVGRNRLARHVGREVFELDQRRHRPEHPGYGWAGNARPTPSADLWDELASLRREPGARAPGAWLASSLINERARSAGDLQRRLDRIAEAFEQAADQLCNG